MIRRQTQIEFVDDALPAHWWQCLALGDFELLDVRLAARSDSATIAHAQAWDMSWFGRIDSRARIGLISLEVSANHRRKGYGRFLVSEIFRRARENQIGVVAVQTAETNAPGARVLCIARLQTGRTRHMLPVARQLFARRVISRFLHYQGEVSWHDAH